MEKGNKIRFIVWGLIWLVVIFASFYGMFSYYKGYGNSGKIRKELSPLITAFNNLEKVKRLNNSTTKFKATLTKKGLDVKYETSTSSLFFNLEYQTLNDEKLLHLKYNNVDETIGILVVSSMFDAISVKKGHKEGELFDKFEFGELYKTTIEQGGKIETSDNVTNVYMNIDKTLLDTMTEEVLMKLYINEDDLEKMNEELAKENAYTYSYVKDDTQLYIETTKDKYIIYLRNGYYDNNLYKSMLSVINKLPLSDETKKQFKENYIVVSTNANFGNYIITLDTDVSLIDFFKLQDKVVKIEISKDKDIKVENNNPINNEELAN